MSANRVPIVAVCATLFIGAAAGCSRPGDRDAASVAVSASPPAAGTALSPGDAPEGERVDIADFRKEPSRYVGRRVTVEGPVANVLSESALAIGEEGSGQGPGLLVLLPSRSEALPQRGRVVVSGTVQLYDRDALRSRYAALATTPEMHARYGGRAVVIADSVRTADGRELAGPLGHAPLPAGSGETGTVGGAGRDRKTGRQPTGSGTDSP